MNVSNSDLAPGFNLFVSFFIGTALVYVYRAWRIYQVRKKTLTGRAEKARIIRDSVDVPAPVAKPKKEAESVASASFTVSAIICFSVAYLITYLVIISLVHVVLPNLNVVDKYRADLAASLILALIAALLIIPLFRRWTVQFASFQKIPNWQRWLWDIGFWIQLAAILSIVISTVPIRTDAISAGQMDILLISSSLALLIFVSFLLPFVRSFVFFPSSWVYSALSNANYQEALQRSRQIQVKFPSDVSVQFTVGTAQIFAGQYSAAEETYNAILQEALVNDQYLPFSPMALTNLGYAFLHQQRYPEAARAFEGARKLDPKAGHAVAGSAEVFLFQRIQTKRALDIIIEYLHKVLAGGLRDRTVWGAVLGDEAWAFAMLGKQREAEASLKDAFQRMDRSFKPGMAGLHYRAGQVYKRNNRTRAIKEFESAVKLDPEGSWGQLARQALQELGKAPRA